jgi:hypothetical protein
MGPRSGFGRNTITGENELEYTWHFSYRGRESTRNGRCVPTPFPQIECGHSHNSLLRISGRHVRHFQAQIHRKNVTKNTQRGPPTPSFHLEPRELERGWRRSRMLLFRRLSRAGNAARLDSHQRKCEINIFHKKSRRWFDTVGQISVCQTESTIPPEGLELNPKQPASGIVLLVKSTQSRDSGPSDGILWTRHLTFLRTLRFQQFGPN